VQKKKENEVNRLRSYRAGLSALLNFLYFFIQLTLQSLKHGLPHFSLFRVARCNRLGPRPCSMPVVLSADRRMREGWYLWMSDRSCRWSVWQSGSQWSWRRNTVALTEHGAWQTAQCRWN